MNFQLFLLALESVLLNILLVYASLLGEDHLRNITLAQNSRMLKKFRKIACPLMQLTCSQTPWKVFLPTKNAQDVIGKNTIQIFASQLHYIFSELRS